MQRLMFLVDIIGILASLWIAGIIVLWFKQKFFNGDSHAKKGGK